MSIDEVNKSTSRSKKKLDLKHLYQGIRGRTIPQDEFSLKIDQLKKLAEESNSEAFTEFLYTIYNIKSHTKNK